MSGSCTLLDPSTLTPGVRETVAWLRRLGFETTDSGDAVTNVAAGMEGALEIPHVAIVVPRRRLVHAALRLYRKLRQRGIEVRPNGRGGVEIHASFDPVDRVAVSR